MMVSENAKKQPGNIVHLELQDIIPLNQGFAGPAYVNVMVRDELKTSTSYQVHDRQRCIYRSLRTQSQVGESVLASARSDSPIILQPEATQGVVQFERSSKKAARQTRSAVAQSLVQRNFPASGSSLSFFSSTSCCSTPEPSARPVHSLFGRPVAAAAAIFSMSSSFWPIPELLLTR
jgi:hypothetical protein